MVYSSVATRDAGREGGLAMCGSGLAEAAMLGRAVMSS
jgi:hypothetical protein